MLARKSLITIIFIPFLLYISTICPTIYWRDSPEFIDVAYTFGIAHPAGSPAYSTISKLFTFLPFFSISFKINLVSLFFALLTVVFVCKVILMLLNIYFPEINKKEANLILILCSLLIVTMFSFWLKAIVAEVYTMNAFFLVLILYFLFKWSVKIDFRYVLLAAFLYGLSLGVHAGAVLFLPGFILFFFLNCPKQKVKGHDISKSKDDFRRPETLPVKPFALLCLFFFLGFSIYLYLPVRSVTNPEFDWGNPETLTNFFSHISDKKDFGSYYKNMFHLSSFLKYCSTFIKIVVNEITLPGLMLTIVGMAVHFKKSKSGFFLLFLTAFINTLFYLLSTFGKYKNGILFIPSFVVFIIWVSFGAYFIRNMQTKAFSRINLKRLSVPIVVIFVLYSVSINYKKVDKSNYYLTEDVLKKMYSGIEANSIVFASQHWFVDRYFQDVENLRSDLIIIHMNDLRAPDIFKPVTKNRYPMLEFPEIVSTKDTFYNFWPLFIKENANKRKILADMSLILTEAGNISIHPYDKFLMRIQYSKQGNKQNPNLDKYYKELQKSIRSDISQNAFFFDQEEGVKTYYNIFLYNFANYLRLSGDFTRALSFLNLAESLLNEETKGIPLMKAICLAELGKYKESEKTFRNLLAEYPNDTLILTNLGNLYFKMKDYNKAEKHLIKAINMDDNLSKAHFILGEVYYAKDKNEESIVEIKKAIGMTKNPFRSKKMENYLQNILRKKAQGHK